MERLTERAKDGTAMAVCCGNECQYNYCCENGGFTECRGIEDIIDRLAAIEDILGDEYDLDRLRELAQADRDGRCVVYQPGYTVASEYYKDGDFFIRETAGVISEVEYIAALKGEQNG